MKRKVNKIHVIENSETEIAVAVFAIYEDTSLLEGTKQPWALKFVPLTKQKE